MMFSWLRRRLTNACLIELSNTRIRALDLGKHGKAFDASPS
jgi:hypothetical protein